MFFDPYTYENGVRKDKFKLSEGQGLFRFLNMNATANLVLSSNNFSKNILNSNKGSEYERNFIYRNYHYFYDFNSPWNLAMSFTMNMENKFTN